MTLDHPETAEDVTVAPDKPKRTRMHEYLIEQERDMARKHGQPGEIFQMAAAVLDEPEFRVMAAVELRRKIQDLVTLGKIADDMGIKVSQAINLRNAGSKKLKKAFTDAGMSTGTSRVFLQYDPDAAPMTSGQRRRLGITHRMPKSEPALTI